MKYEETVRALFLKRKNRFVAQVELDGTLLDVHVKNTGRCRELLVPGNAVILSRADNPKRKTPYDLVAVYRGNGRLFNMDSQAPNAVTGEWLKSLNIFDEIRPEYTIGDSRFDFHMIRDGREHLLEVKGCTLVREDGIGYFPDAPTERGVKHLKELAELSGRGYRCSVAFVIQTEGVYKVLPNMETHPAFGEALEAAAGAGVEIRCLPCRVWEDRLEIAPGTAW